MRGSWNFRSGSSTAFRILSHGSKVIEYKGEEKQAIEGDVLIAADILRDWREEIVTSLPGELRVDSTNIVADSGRVCLMQNQLYRMAVATAGVGCYNTPQAGFK